ncbi:uncharacterized protein LOC135931745 [Gordionus sp. m RMFG-2023]|uniref:uncharacterized protein LOC135931745 n=1 Tax=Gordionus sp. m RMFG-2023 TaxID=3053472 RepID=UPI0031FBAD01
MNSGHNHDLDYNLFMRLPKQSKINDESRSLIVKCLKYDASIPKIKYDLQQKGVYTTNRDLYNIKKKILYQPGDSELLDVFNLLKNLNPNNIIKIVSENNALHGIYYQTPNMKDYFIAFPEILLVDATYKLNYYQMPVFTLFVIDGEEQTRFAAIWIVKSENYLIVKNMCDLFKSYNDNNNKIKVIIADKDFADRHAYREAFPMASLEICTFHVQQTFIREITVKKRNINSTQVKVVLNLLKKNDLHQNRGTLLGNIYSLMALNFPDVEEYFNNNWHNIRHEWSYPWRCKTTNFSIYTNNRTESMNRVLKTPIKNIQI